MHAIRRVPAGQTVLPKLSFLRRGGHQSRGEQKNEARKIFFEDAWSGDTGTGMGLGLVRPTSRGSFNTATL